MASTKKTKPLIAIVDDDASVSRALKRLVRSAGMEADTFATGEEFMDLIEGAPWFRVGGIVLDVQDGLKIRERLTQAGYTIPVIFMTTDNQAEVREKALAAGAVAFLCKPFESELFIKTLHEAVRRSAHRDTHVP